MVQRLGPCIITSSGKGVIWTGTATIKVGKDSSLTLQNTSNQAAEYQEMEEFEVRQRLMGWSWKEAKWDTPSFSFGPLKKVVIGPGATYTWRGKSKVEEHGVGPFGGNDVWKMNRWYVTYLVPSDGANMNDSPPNGSDDPLPWDSQGDGGPPYTEDPDAGGGGNTRMLVILTILIAILAAYSGWKAKSLLIARTLGLR